MNYAERTTVNQDRTDVDRYVKECYIHCDEKPTGQQIDDTLAYWRNSVAGRTLQQYSSFFHGKMCDVGCGFGALPIILLELCPKVTNITGIDIFYKAIVLADKYTQHLGLGDRTDFKLADFTSRKLDMACDQFDGVVSLHTLEHIYNSDLDQFARNINKIMKIGAVLLISVPYDHAYGSPEHVSFFVEDDLRRLFERHGFGTVVIEQAPFDLLNGVFRKTVNVEHVDYPC